MPNTLDTWVGQQLDNGRYQMESLLGKGGMGSVFLAVDTRLSTKIVVKVPNPTLLADEGFALRFSREIRSLVALDHPHIVSISDVGEHEGIPYLVMAYLGGGNLEDRRVRVDDDTCEPMDPAELRDWLPHVADALDFIHARNYLHRDIKPGNILFDTHGHVFLGDFGIAKAVHSDEQAQATLTQAGVVGTPGFIAPEILVGKEYDGRADQYSLAVVIHELLSGRRLFAGTNLFAVANQQTKRAATPLIKLVPSVAPALSESLKRSLSRNPDRRFPSCSDLSRSILQSLPRSATGREKPPPQKTQHSPKRTAAKPPSNRQATVIEKPGRKPQGSAPATMIEQPEFVETVRQPTPGAPPRPGASAQSPIQSIMHSTHDTDERRKRLYWGLGIGIGVTLISGVVLLLACLLSLFWPASGRVEGELASDDDMSVWDGWYSDRFEFEADSGQRVTIRLSSDDFDTYVALWGPNGQWEENDDFDYDGGTYISVIDDVELYSSGTHEAIVTSNQEGTTGNYVLEVEVDGSPVALIPAKGDFVGVDETY